MNATGNEENSGEVDLHLRKWYVHTLNMKSKFEHEVQLFLELFASASRTGLFILV